MCLENIAFMKGETMNQWLGIFDDGCVMCEYTFITADTNTEAKTKFKTYLSGRGIPAPDAFINILDTSRFATI
jgi:hypothetical protein